MSKDPAFLLYSKDFYEGTRTMLPEERACYVDLMIYQHQNGGFIPNDIPRVLMYCSGITKATLEATLEAKFKLGDKGWYNQKLKGVVEERQKFTEKQSINGVVGQFWKRAKRILSAKEEKKLRSLVSQFTSDNKDFLDDWINNYKDPKAMLQAMLKHLEDVNGIVVVNKDEKEEGLEKSEKPFAGLIFPWITETFKAQWKLYKVYRKKKHKFIFLNTDSENRKLNQLHNMAKGDERTAIKIIQQTIDNAWTDFYELKGNQSKTKCNFATNR